MIESEPETYGKLCAEYYDLEKPVADQRMLRYYLARAKESPGAILEPMCGTGSFLLPMVQEGLDVCGFDISKWMLAILRRRAKALNLRPDVWRGTIDGLRLERRFGLIFIPNGSINLLVADGEVRRAFAILLRHLVQEGRLVFDLETEGTRGPVSQSEPWTSELARPTGGRSIRLTSLSVAGAPGVETSLSSFDVVQGGQVIESETELFQFRHYRAGEIVAWLGELGATDIRVLKRHSDEPAGEHDAIVTVQAGPVASTRAAEPSR